MWSRSKRFQNIGFASSSMTEPRVSDVAQLVEFSGVFEPLREPEFFARATVHPELGAVCWPNNADLDSDVLYAKVAGVSVPNYAIERRRA
jgi:hypothetical protein